MCIAHHYVGGKWRLRMIERSKKKKKRMIGGWEEKEREKREKRVMWTP